jgi:DNA-binding transcriptional LysR family regulator
MDMDLNEIVVFTRVVQAGSFTAASKALGMPKSTVSRKVSDLEERLHTRLLQRTTRTLSLTDAGRTYFDYGARILSELEQAERAVGSLQETPRGLLRVTTGLNAAWLGDIFAGFLKRYPDVQLDVMCTPRYVDLIEERVDVGIRAGALADSSLVARPLGKSPLYLVAAPSYFRKRRRPRTPAELKEHDFLLFGAATMTFNLRLERADADAVQVAMHARLVIGDMDVVHASAITGLGIALLPAYRCVGELESGALERVLPEWAPPAAPIHIVYPTARHVSPTVRAFVEHVQKCMTPPPWEL